MHKNKSNKKIPELIASFENILVCNNKQLRPFVEIFVFEPENVTQKNLGTLMGVFEVADTSEDSSYIVNYLSSVIKKEYFSKPKRVPIESFEAALHRANLALSKIAEHGNVKWIGKLNAIIAIVEKNNLHLSQAGTASALLLRSKGLTDISEDLASAEPDPHPLKTFVNVSSGRLEDQDKLIVTTEEIFEIFSLEEIKKSALRFAGEKFTRFLKTALGNELEKVAVLVVDIQEKAAVKPAAVVQNDRSVNAFSQSAFFREPALNASAAADAGGPAHNGIPKNSGTPVQEKISAEMTEEIAKEIQTSQPEFTNEKNGHIYIKETMEESLDIKPSVDYAAAFNKQIGAAHKSLKRISRGSGLLLLNAARKISLPKVKLPKISLPAKKISEPKITEKITNAELLEKIAPHKIIPARNASHSDAGGPVAAPKSYATPFYEKAKNVFSGKNKEFLLAYLDKASKKITTAITVLTPDFSKIKKIIDRLDYQQRIYAVVIVLAIFVVPLLGLKLSAYIQSKKPKPVEPVVEVVVPPLSQDKNVIRVENLNSVLADADIATVVNLNDKLFAVSQNQITDLSSKEAAPLPGDFGKIKLATGMDDLNLLLLMNQNGRIISFSPVPKKFQDNAISIPAGADISAAGTYLTYLYLTDAANSQIYRYPRAEGGFGASTNWLKDSVDLSKVSGMALNDNIFAADNNALTKLFKGKKQDFNLETSATPITPFKVFTKPEFSSVYILDKHNSRLVKIDPTGQIISQYYNPEIASANDFAIDETNNTAYISTPISVFSFPIN